MFAMQVRDQLRPTGDSYTVVLQHLVNQQQNASNVRPLLRSLLQKAVRRGYVELAQKVAFILASHGDSSWLHTRTGVITFEECWPYASLLNSDTPSALTLCEVAAAMKNKDAAGLGSLAQAAVEGDATAIEQALEPVAVKIVAAGLKRPESFFKWAMGECSSEEQAEIVLAARRFFGRASWPWDKAFMVAGTYLSIRAEVPQVSRPEQLPLVPFPYWIAVDKHTPQGKIALRKIALTLHFPEQRLQWASFYFESAKTHASMTSPWWDCETKWRLAALGLSLDEAQDMWAKASPHVESAVQSQTDLLLQLVSRPNENTLL